MICSLRPRAPLFNRCRKGREHAARLVVLASLIVVLGLGGGCSRIGFLYAQTDWVVLRWVEEYIDLTDGQRDRLKRDIADLHAWHCRTQLPRVSDLLGAFEADAAAGRLTPGRVGEYGGQVESLAVELLGRAAPAAARLLADLSPEQLDGLYRALAKGNADEVRRIRVSTPPQAALEYQGHVGGEFERWIGPLRPDQEAQVADWARDFRSLGLLGLDYRRAWQARLRPRISAARGAPERMESVIADVRERWSADEPPAYRDTLAHNRRLTHALVATVLTGADATQRAHLRRFVTGLRTDLAAIRCGP